MKFISDIYWADSENWWIVALLLGAAILVSAYRLFKVRRSIAQLNRWVGAKRFLINASFAKYSFKTILWLTGFLFLVLTLLHPQWDKKEEKIAQQGRDLFIALDISRSMLAQDVKPSRLEYAKKKIKALVNALSCERVGLILFSGSSFISCPLTRDYHAFFMFLDQIDVESISSGTTVIDSAIAQAAQAFSENSLRKHKLLVLITDGENFSPTLAATKEKARAVGLTVFALGIGTADGAPIPLYDPHGGFKGHQKNSDGTIVISKLNEPLLRSLTQDLQGMYLLMTEDNRDVTALKNQLEKFEKEQIDEKTIEQFQEQYPWFLLVSFCAFALEWVV